MSRVVLQWLWWAALVALLGLVSGCQGRAGISPAARGTVLLTLDSPNPQILGEFGYALAMGDVDGDRKADIAVGVPREDVGASANQGRAYVFSGATGDLLFTLDNPDPQNVSEFGAAVAMGDLDGDGRADVAVGAPEKDPSAYISEGRAYLFSGATGNFLRILDIPDPGTFTQFGNNWAMGDFDGDGKADTAVGVADDDASGEVTGRAYILSGATGNVLRTLDAPNPQTDAEFGHSVAMGDVDGDGRAEVIVGTRREDVGGTIDEGRAYVFAGATGDLLFTLDHPNPQAEADFGFALATGDVDGDGKADITVAARLEDVGGNTSQGRAYVFSGATGDLLFTLDSPNPQAYAGEFGWALAMGDVDGDGQAEVAVGAASENVGTSEAQGRVYVFTLPPAGSDG